ncbi:hypothetical protein [Luteolibacter sp. LG18]|uniref:hypothetical protein n=1 Tax=Luteolibacter sp. LG18 TaxID=2819286 RepID=UPI002B27F532|nr:hypothetical protein llg_28580 [Luteolibacter sp. LG18]
MAAKSRAAQRAAAAKKLEQLVKNLIPALEKIPSYRGKAAFMDRVHKIEKHAYSLAWALDYDAAEESEKRRSS